MEIITESSQQTKKIGRFLGEEILGSQLKLKNALVLALRGELGSGKTTFIQGLAQGLNISEKITSPTFVIMRQYQAPGQDLVFCHIDCYRVLGKDLLELGFREILSNPHNIIAVEWAEKIKNLLPDKAIWLEFEYLNQDRRKIKIKNNVGGRLNLVKK